MICYQWQCEELCWVSSLTKADLCSGRLTLKWMIHLVSMWLLYHKNLSFCWDWTFCKYSRWTDCTSSKKIIFRIRWSGPFIDSDSIHLVLWPSVMNSIQDFLGKIPILHSLEENAFGFGLAWLVSVTNMSAVSALLCLWQCETHGSCRWGSVPSSLTNHLMEQDYLLIWRSVSCNAPSAHWPDGGMKGGRGGDRNDSR